MAYNATAQYIYRLADKNANPRTPKPHDSQARNSVAIVSEYKGNNVNRSHLSNELTWDHFNNDSNNKWNSFGSSSRPVNDTYTNLQDEDSARSSTEEDNAGSSQRRDISPWYRVQSQLRLSGCPHSDPLRRRTISDEFCIAARVHPNEINNKLIVNEFDYRANASFDNKTNEDYYSDLLDGPVFPMSDFQSNMDDPRSVEHIVVTTNKDGRKTRFNKNNSAQNEDCLDSCVPYSEKTNYQRERNPLQSIKHSSQYTAMKDFQRHSIPRQRKSYSKPKIRGRYSSTNSNDFGSSHYPTNQTSNHYDCDNERILDCRKSGRYSLITEVGGMSQNTCSPDVADGKLHSKAQQQLTDCEVVRRRSEPRKVSGKFVNEKRGIPRVKPIAGRDQTPYSGIHKWDQPSCDSISSQAPKRDPWTPQEFPRYNKDVKVLSHSQKVNTMNDKQRVRRQKSIPSPVQTLSDIEKRFVNMRFRRHRENDESRYLGSEKRQSLSHTSDQSGEESQYLLKRSNECKFCGRNSEDDCSSKNCSETRANISLPDDVCSLLIKSLDLIKFFISRDYQSNSNKNKHSKEPSTCNISCRSHDSLCHCTPFNDCSCNNSKQALTNVMSMLQKEFCRQTTNCFRQKSCRQSYFSPNRICVNNPNSRFEKDNLDVDEKCKKQPDPSCRISLKSCGTNFENVDRMEDSKIPSFSVNMWNSSSKRESKKICIPLFCDKGVNTSLVSKNCHTINKSSQTIPSGNSFHIRETTNKTRDSAIYNCATKHIGTLVKEECLRINLEELKDSVTCPNMYLGSNDKKSSSTQTSFISISSDDCTAEDHNNSVLLDVSSEEGIDEVDPPLVTTGFYMRKEKANVALNEESGDQNRFTNNSIGTDCDGTEINRNPKAHSDSESVKLFSVEGKICDKDIGIVDSERKKIVAIRRLTEGGSNSSKEYKDKNTHVKF